MIANPVTDDSMNVDWSMKQGDIDTLGSYRLTVKLLSWSAVAQVCGLEYRPYSIFHLLNIFCTIITSTVPVSVPVPTILILIQARRADMLGRSPCPKKRKRQLRKEATRGICQPRPP